MTPVIGFVGLSHLGLVSAVAAAAKGFAVVAYDPDQQLCSELNKGRLPIFEPDLHELLTRNRDRLRFSADPSSLVTCAVVYIARDVPTDDDGRSDLSDLEDLIHEVVGHISPEAALVVLSQVFPGFTRELCRRIRQNNVACLPVYYQVETLIFGQAVERALHPERLIVGCADPRVALPADYAAVLSSFACPIMPMRYESAELAKIAINACLVSSIAVANTLAELCEVIGADWSEIIPALKLDRRIGPHAYLSPGLGIAGGNLERDLATVRTLANEHGTDAGVVDAWLTNSRHRLGWVQKIIHAEVVARVEEPTVAVWGLAYKPGTASTKNSPALALIEWLRQFTVRVYDPEVHLLSKEGAAADQVESALEACHGADVLAIMTPWPEFAAIDLARLREAMTGRVIVDPLGVLDQDQCVEAGFSCFQLGVANTFVDKEKV